MLLILLHQIYHLEYLHLCFFLVILVLKIAHAKINSSLLERSLLRDKMFTARLIRCVRGVIHRMARSSNSLITSRKKESRKKTADCLGKE